MRLAAIESERHFVQIGREMLGANTMPRSHDSTLEKRERGFNRVRGDHEAVLVADIFVRSVIHGLALRYLALGKARGIEDRFIGYDHVYIFADVLLKHFADCFRVGIFNVDEFQIATALNDSDNWLFLAFAVAHAFASLLTSDVHLVNLDCAVQHLMNFGHCEADSVAEIPCGFVTDSERAFDLICRHPFLGFTEQQGSEKPLLQSKMAVIENGAAGDTELIVAAFAVEQLLCSSKVHGWHFAPWAFNAIGPTEPDQQLTATFICVEQIYNVN